MLINFTNHPSSEWQQSQLDSAIELYGGIIDLHFPEVDPMASTSEIEALAESCFRRLMETIKEKDVIHIMGEMTLTYAILNKLKTKGIECIASCSERICTLNEQGQTVRTFNFRQFRHYF